MGVALLVQEVIGNSWDERAKEGRGLVDSIFNLWDEFCLHTIAFLFKHLFQLYLQEELAKVGGRSSFGKGIYLHSI